MLDCSRRPLSPVHFEVVITQHQFQCYWHLYQAEILHLRGDNPILVLLSRHFSGVEMPVQHLMSRQTISPAENIDEEGEQCLQRQE